MKVKLKCKNKDCAREFEVMRVLSKAGDATPYDANFNPIVCVDCSFDSERIEEENDGFPALGKWSAMNTSNQLDKSMKAAQKRNAAQARINRDMQS